MNYIVQPLGDQAVRIEFPDEKAQISELCSQIAASSLDGVVDIVPGLSSITVFYEYPVTDYERITKKIEPLLNDAPAAITSSASRLVVLPTVYGGHEHGPDLENVAHQHQVSPQDIINKHSGTIYHVKMLGFLPGFPYLSGLPNSLHTPRLSTPRVRVEAGSVGIGGEQTGVYPISSPGGWNLIGRTPIPLFSPKDGEPFLLQPGDRLQFQPISDAEFSNWTRKINKDSSWKKEVIFNEKN